jgi:hypothetical protein
LIIEIGEIVFVINKLSYSFLISSDGTKLTNNGTTSKSLALLITRLSRLVGPEVKRGERKFVNIDPA